MFKLFYFYHYTPNRINPLGKKIDYIYYFDQYMKRTSIDAYVDSQMANHQLL